MSVRHASRRDRPHRPGSARARGTLSVIGAAAAHAVRGAMRPVERLNAELDGIDIEEPDLGRRVSVPATGGDAEELAGRVNVLLARLDRAVLRRRSFASPGSTAPAAAPTAAPASAWPSRGRWPSCTRAACTWARARPAPA